MQEIQPNPQQPRPDTIPFHRHTGVDGSPKINSKNLLTSPTVFQTISVADATVAPTYYSQEGTVLFQYDASHFVGWVKINSLWKKFTLS